MDMKRALGIGHDDAAKRHKQLRRYINLKLAALGLPIHKGDTSGEFFEVAHDLLANYREQNRQLAERLCSADQRIQSFLERYLYELKDEELPRLPNQTLTLDHHGLARELSLPPDCDEFANENLQSYRIAQGVLHNPRSDRRTTKGVFHIAAGGLPVPADKKEVPKIAFARLLQAAFNPPADLLDLPYTSTQNDHARCFVSLLLRPTVCPLIPGRRPAQSMEMRFFVPGGLVCNLDFVESIFGNAGDPYLPENDAGLDVDHWTGHTGCVILATHIRGLKKKDLGLPNIAQATERQKRDGMCWEHEDELYNDGQAFKLCVRNAEGVVVTLISDNYFGYCKKEIKTQISYSANLFGLSEEEHAGGALAFPSYNLGDNFHIDSRVISFGQTFEELVERYGSILEVRPEGYAVDKHDDRIIYVPENAQFSRKDGHVSWNKGDHRQQIPLLSRNIYIYPFGYKVHFEKHPTAESWRLVGTRAEGVFCHKPCTVSGGGKSEISKSISDAIIYGPIFVSDFRQDMNQVQELLDRNYMDRMLPELRQDYDAVPSRSILSVKRTLGSVIKLFTPSPGEFTPEYNEWLENLPNHIKALVFTVKRFYKQEWNGDWRSYFSVDNVNGKQGHELRFEGRKLMASYLRVGVDSDRSWQTHKLRQDFVPAVKVQMEDDITASVVIPQEWLTNYQTDYPNLSVKLIDNCEYRFFQRPDDAINRGYDKQAEADLAGDNVFVSNFQPLEADEARMLVSDEVAFDAWTEPMQTLIRGAALRPDGYVVSSAHPRMVDGKPTKNPRYLQTRPSLIDQRHRYVAEMGARLLRRVPLGEHVIFPVHAVLPGRRNNPADREAGIRPLAVYAPVHYQELPELFMDFICSLTGKSPSTTGAGSEGALTKGPFNALRATADLNNALVSWILTGYNGYTSAAGYVGGERRVDHDISLLIPELWCRLTPQDVDPQRLILEGYLEKLDDFEQGGRTVLASRLGYRLSDKFIHSYFGRVFDHPDAVFDEAMLRPETQNLDDFIDGIDNIVEAQQRVAQAYFDDGSIDDACPPLRVLLHIMVKGDYQGKTIDDPELRKMFSREYLLESDWYRERLFTKQQREIHLWESHCTYLADFLRRTHYQDEAHRLGIEERLRRADKMLRTVRSMKYLDSLIGTIGADPLGSGSDVD